MYLPAILKYLLSIEIILFGVLAYANQNSNMLNVCIITCMLVQILPIFFVKRLYYNYAKDKETIYINGHEWMHVIYNDDSKNSYYASDGEYFY